MIRLKEAMRTMGDWDDKVRVPVWNRTGAALTKGDLCAFNYDFVNGTYNGIDITAETAFIRANVVAVTTSNARGVVAVADEAIAADETGWVLLGGSFVDIECNGAVNAGEYLCAVNGQTYAEALTQAEIIALDTDLKGILGIAAETQASGTNVLKAAEFDGHVWKTLVGNDA